MTDICLFPIPNCVTFPGTVFPLHVFEPRYRKMIRYCLENKALLGICHTQKQLGSSKTFNNLDEALKSNQASYKPYEIFSAGYCELNNTTDDGRMYLDVYMQARYKAIHEKQTLPFLIYDCEPYPDASVNDLETHESLLIKQQLLEHLQQLTKNNAQMQEKFANENWQHQSIQAFSYELFGVLTFPPEIQQQILATPSILERLQLALNLVTRHSLG